jgi:hypothetical protein
METPLNPRRLPVEIGMDILSDLKGSMLKPLSTSQKALDTRPVWVLLISWTSSRPNVLLSVQIDRIPSRNGSPKLGPELIVLLLGKMLPTKRLKKGTDPQDLPSKSQSLETKKWNHRSLRRTCRDPC